MANSIFAFWNFLECFVFSIFFAKYIYLFIFSLEGDFSSVLKNLTVYPVSGGGRCGRGGRTSRYKSGWGCWVLGFLRATPDYFTSSWEDTCFGNTLSTASSSVFWTVTFLMTLSLRHIHAAAFVSIVIFLSYFESEGYFWLVVGWICGCGTPG